MFRIRYGLAPSYLETSFTSIGSIHSYGTRGSTSNYHVSKECALLANSFSFLATKDWNSLPSSLKAVSRYSSFKKKLKDYLISAY